MADWYQFGIMRVMAMTLRLTDAESDALRARAELEGRSMQDVAREAVREYVERHYLPAASAFRGRRAVTAVSRSPASRAGGALPVTLPLWGRAGWGRTNSLPLRGRAGVGWASPLRGRAGLGVAA